MSVGNKGPVTAYHNDALGRQGRPPVIVASDRKAWNSRHMLNIIYIFTNISKMYYFTNRFSFSMAFNKLPSLPWVSLTISIFISVIFPLISFHRHQCFSSVADRILSSGDISPVVIPYSGTYTIGSYPKPFSPLVPPLLFLRLYLWL